jgi:hypothetical protein
VSDSSVIRKTLGKFQAVTAFHGHVHHTIYKKIGNMTSIGTMSTSWPWPYPPIELPDNKFQQYRADPANTADGMGSASVDIRADSQFVKYEPFGDSLQPAIRDGFKV